MIEEADAYDLLQIDAVLSAAYPASEVEQQLQEFDPYAE